MQWFKALTIGCLCLLISSCKGESPIEEDLVSQKNVELEVVEEVEDPSEVVEEILPEVETVQLPEIGLIEVPLPMVFRIDEIDEVMTKAMMGNSYYENDSIQIMDLRYVQIGYYGFDGLPHQGAIVVHEVIAEDVLEIFTELYDVQYPFESITPIDVYGGDDDASMVANNTSAFNYRVIAGTSRLSRHAYGLAIDINPLMNPWVTSHGIYPVEGRVYADRTLDQEGLIIKGDPCYQAFISRGFEWGGDWKSSKDYQHFDRTIEGIND